MKASADQLASLASILGAVVTLLGLMQSAGWLIAVGVCFLGTAIAAVAYARRERGLLKAAEITVEGRNLDSLNIANLRRRLNRSLVVQRAYHLAKVDGQALTMSWQYEGFCRIDKETTMEFSIDSETHVRFGELECFAFDLQQDPGRLHKITPLLVGSDGLSKKVALPFLKPCLLDHPFNVQLNCVLPFRVSAGVHYYTSTLSFDQRSVHRLAVHLLFEGNAPDWLRVYECEKGSQPKLVNDLRPFKQELDTCEYIDLAEDVPGQSTRIYAFYLPSPSSPRKERLIERN
jgi:hypothetical protein